MKVLQQMYIFFYFSSYTSSVSHTHCEIDIWGHWDPRKTMALESMVSCTASLKVQKPSQNPRIHQHRAPPVKADRKNKIKQTKQKTTQNFFDRKIPKSWKCEMTIFFKSAEVIALGSTVVRKCSFSCSEKYAQHWCLLFVGLIIQNWKINPITDYMWKMRHQYLSKAILSPQ